ncbi:hypothetical protein LBBP_00438 [Leptospira borgpetersenii serovar Ballum]|uniref:Uncharacterized protein n=1 Tax=Leptospira borgpetersenii serovar Ballum TaxID=280505 RepID=A0A0S2IMG3_LEPBO|nr:hypothetical protein LBBP_00438 [Leptospira borgpetersenii serovar Ballum]
MRKFSVTPDFFRVFLIRSVSKIANSYVFVIDFDCFYNRFLNFFPLIFCTI